MLQGLSKELHSLGSFTAGVGAQTREMFAPPNHHCACQCAVPLQAAREVGSCALPRVSHADSQGWRPKLAAWKKVP